MQQMQVSHTMYPFSEKSISRLFLKEIAESKSTKNYYLVLTYVYISELPGLRLVQTVLGMKRWSTMSFCL